MKNTSKPSQSGRRWPVWLAVALVATGLFVGGADSVHALDGWSPPQAPPTAVECLDKYLDGLERCKALYCFDLFWFIPLGCDEPEFTNCNQSVMLFYDICLGSAVG